MVVSDENLLSTDASGGRPSPSADENSGVRAELSQAN